MAKYGRYYESKTEQKEAHQMALILFVSPIVIGIVAGFGQYAFTGSFPGEKVSSNGISCNQAQNQWEAAKLCGWIIHPARLRALDARDGITPAEATTGFGRAKWEQLRDKANELEQFTDNICN